MTYGATAEEWAHFDLVLGLGEDLLPTVCDPAVAPSPNSRIREQGRTPSIVNRDGYMAGIKDWTRLKANGELKRWSRDVRYGICLQTRNVRAIDIDVPDADLAQRIADAVTRILGFPLPVRRRENTAKRLLAVTVKGDIHKKILTVANGHRVEFLGTGQMFVAAGARVDGSRYYWEDGLPDTIPEITLEQYNALIAQLTAEFGVEPVRETSSGDRRKGEHLDLEDPVASWLVEQGLALEVDERNGLIHVECPWNDEHTSGNPGDSSTSWFIAGSNGHREGHFKCLHAHCSGRNRSDFLQAVGYEQDIAGMFEDLGPDPDAGKGEEQAEAKPGASFALIPAFVFAGMPSGTWLIKDVIPKADLGVIYGASGAGKTFAVLELMMAVARGVPWRGKRVRQGRVVYIAAEGAAGFRKRLVAYAQHHSVDLKDVDLLILPASPNLLDAGEVKRLTKAIEGAGEVAAIVVDTFAQTTPGGNENSAEDMGLAIAHVRAVGRKAGAVVILVHHAGKDASKGARGWSGIRAAADFEIEITRDGDLRTINTTKQKDADDSQSWGFKLQEVTIGIDEDGDPITSCVLLESDVQVEAGVRGGGKRVAAEKAEKGGRWEQIVASQFAELALGGDVLQSELLLRSKAAAAEAFPEEKTKRVNYLVGRAFEGMCRKGSKQVFFVDQGLVYEVAN